MSTYNGERYLREQLDSILSQQGVELSLLVRDDGSSDSTAAIVEEYATGHKNVHFYRGENLRPAMSFMNLVQQSPEADYYALADQDDVWDRDKLICAVHMLEERPDDKALMYYSNLRIVDQDLNFFRLAHSQESQRIQTNKYSCLIDPVATGCTVVFNRTAAHYLRRKMPEKISMHDTWIYMVCKMFGEVVYDFQAHISYRQHGSNVIGTYLDKKTLSMYKKRLLRLLDRDLQPRYCNAVSFMRCYGDLLSAEDRFKVNKLVEYKSSFSKKMRLLMDKDLRPRGISGLFRYIVLVLLEIV